LGSLARGSTKPYSKATMRFQKKDRSQSAQRQRGTPLVQKAAANTPRDRRIGHRPDQEVRTKTCQKSQSAQPETTEKIHRDAREGFSSAQKQFRTSENSATNPERKLQTNRKERSGQPQNQKKKTKSREKTIPEESSKSGRRKPERPHRCLMGPDKPTFWMEERVQDQKQRRRRKDQFGGENEQQKRNPARRMGTSDWKKDGRRRSGRESNYWGGESGSRFAKKKKKSGT